MLFWLFRILYGRMKNKTGSKTQGKSASGTRMAIVLRFLAGTQPEEIQLFLDLLSEPVKHFKNGRSPLPPLPNAYLCGELVPFLDVSLCSGAAASPGPVMWPMLSLSVIHWPFSHTFLHRLICLWSSGLSLPPESQVLSSVGKQWRSACTGAG